MRKNLFTDYHRMGLIARYSKDKTETDPLSTQRVKYVSLSEQGLRLVEADLMDEQFFIFSRGVDRLLGGFINVLLRLLNDSDYRIKKIDVFEFTFFVSAIGTRTTFDIDYATCVELIRSFRRLSRIQRRGVKETLAQRLKPENYSGDKTSQRDFHNWINKTEQIYHILNQTVYFAVHDKTLYLRRGKVRSFGEKVQYFKNHGVNLRPGFELQHVVPLSWSESEEQFKLFDKWQNMVYISAFDHAQITQNQNRNVVMNADDGDLILSDFSDNHVYLKHRENILYSIDKQPIMLSYNKRLLQSVD